MYRKKWKLPILVQIGTKKAFIDEIGTNTRNRTNLENVS